MKSLLNPKVDDHCLSLFITNDCETGLYYHVLHYQVGLNGSLDLRMCVCPQLNEVLIPLAILNAITGMPSVDELNAWRETAGPYRYTVLI